MPLLTDPLTHPSRGRMDRAHSSDLPAVTAVRRALAVLVGVLLVVLGGSAAQAHNVLQGTDPADGSTVTVVPQRVTLTFNEPMLAVGTQIMVHTADETMVNIGPPVLVDNTVSQEVTGELPAGEYTVIYRVTSADGHPVEGEFRFTAAEATSYGVATPTATPTPTPTPTASPSASDPTPPVPTPTASSEAAPVEGRVPAGVLIGVAAALVVAGGGVAWLLLRRRSADAAPEPPE